MYPSAIKGNPIRQHKCWNIACLKFAKNECNNENETTYTFNYDDDW